MTSYNVQNFFFSLLPELAKKPWDSALQLLLGGVMLFTMAFKAGPYFGCGPGNADGTNGALACMSGSMPLTIQIVMVICIALASLCWGRAVKLLETRSASQK